MTLWFTKNGIDYSFNGKPEEIKGIINAFGNPTTIENIKIVEGPYSCYHTKEPYLRWMVRRNDGIHNYDAYYCNLGTALNRMQPKTT